MYLQHYNSNQLLYIFEKKKGQIESIVFKDGTKEIVKTLYAKPQFELHRDLSKLLGCELAEQRYAKVDTFQEITIY